MIEKVTAYQNGRFEMVALPAWWKTYRKRNECIGLMVWDGDDEPRQGANLNGAPTGFIASLTGNNDSNTLEIWCPTEADAVAFLCGPGAAFATACAAVTTANHPPPGGPNG